MVVALVCTEPLSSSSSSMLLVLVLYSLAFNRARALQQPINKRQQLCHEKERKQQQFVCPTTVLMEVIQLLVVCILHSTWQGPCIRHGIKTSKVRSSSCEYSIPFSIQSSVDLERTLQQLTPTLTLTLTATPTFNCILSHSLTHCAVGA